ncbi:hypothetical protein LTR74_016611 [Friedmanniomyces endolithicus]|nr:hypothetical protein LTR74_016611 [Friedmanniomyces endolithicus]
MPHNRLNEQKNPYKQNNSTEATPSPDTHKPTGSVIPAGALDFAVLEDDDDDEDEDPVVVAAELPPVLVAEEPPLEPVELGPSPLTDAAAV